MSFCVAVNNTEKLDEMVRYFGLFVSGITIPIGTIGNLATMAVIFSNKLLWSKNFHVILFSLAVVDFLTAGFMLPINFLSYLFKRKFMADFYCEFQPRL